MVAPRPAETFTLANGLQVAVLPSRRAPLVAQYLVYRVGGADDTPGLSGIAHFLEHMMFKGTPQVAAGEFSRTVARHGGRDNAFTSFDATGYHQTIASDRLELVMRMEADRMANLRIVEKEVTTEREVVLEERRTRVDNVPAAILQEQVREALYGRGRPYGVPLSGLPDEIRRTNVPELEAFYRRNYAPNNAVLVIAGDTTADAVRKLADRYYGPIPPRRVEPRRRPAEPGSGLPQRLTHADPRVAEPRWARDWIAPSRRAGETRHADALTVLGTLLGGGETSRLWSALVLDKRLALATSAGYSALPLGLSSFGVDVQPAPRVAIADVETAVDAELKRLLDGGVTASELERAQNRLLAQAIFAQDSFSSGPRIYGSALAGGTSIAEIEGWPTRIAAVTPAQVLDAARHVFRADRSVISLLQPAGVGR